MSVYLVLDGLMLVHWKNADGEKKIDILVPDIEHHKKKIVIDSTKEMCLEHYTYCLNSTSKSGDPLTDWAALSHFCMTEKNVKLSGKGAEANFLGLGWPSRLIGRNRFATSEKLLLNRTGKKIIHRGKFQIRGVACFCETMIFEYEKLELIHGRKKHEVKKSLLIQSIPHKEHTTHPHGEKFNALLLVKGETPNLKVTGMQVGQCVRAVDDPLPPDLPLDREIMDRYADLPGSFLRRSIEMQDCAPNFLIES